MKGFLIFIATIVLVSNSAYCQNNLDSAICKHLVETGQIDKAINTTTKVKDDSFLKNTNYFYSKKPVIRVSNTITVEPVIFGCYVSHTGKNLLITVNVNARSTFYYYGNNKLLADIERLKHEILETVKPSLSDNDEAALINYLSACYL